MYELTTRQKQILRASGWTNEQIEGAIFEDFETAWFYIGDIIGAYYARKQQTMIQEWEEVDREIAEVFRTEFAASSRRSF